VDPSSANKRINIIDIASGSNCMMALSDENQIFVWGRKMAHYYSVHMDSLTHASVAANGHLYGFENDENQPRLIKNNLTYHKITKLISGHGNCCLITRKGELLIQGMNEFGQLALSPEISQGLLHFPEFMKIDALSDFFVSDVAIGKGVINCLCEHKETKKIHLFGWGNNFQGQLLQPNLKLVQNTPLDLTPRIKSFSMIESESQLCQISSGLTHTLLLSSSGTPLGIGNNQMCQLGTAENKEKNTTNLMGIDLNLEQDQEVTKVVCGELCSFALVSQK
jgi:alpha-tubulin suppressor-like RCC1 family protein